MISLDEKKLFLTLLSTSEVFDKKAKMIIQTGLEQETLPEDDAQYILFVLKNEKNFNAIIDQRGRRLIEKLLTSHYKYE